MNEKNCENPADILVDYANGELAEDEKTQIDEHLSQCQHCRSTVESLRRSLQLAEVIWDDGFEEIQVKSPVAHPKGVWRYLRWAAAAVLLIAAGGGLIWKSISRPAPKPMDEPTLAAIQRQVARAGQAAELLAAADLLAHTPGGGDVASKSYRFIAENYSDFPEAKEAKNRE
jgi:anti-sigma factor RsiW